MKKRVIIAFIAGAVTVTAAQVRFAWDYPADELPSIKQFCLYEMVGTNLVLKTTVTNLTAQASFPTGLHQVAATAVSTNGLESDLSNIVTFFMPRGPSNVIVIPKP